MLDGLGPDRVGLVADLPDLPPYLMRLASLRLGALARCDRLVARSFYSARPLLERYGIEPARVARDPSQRWMSRPSTRRRMPAARVAALRKAWGIPSGVRLMLVPGAVRPAHGQIGAGGRGAPHCGH